jgi:biopolymer transport protein ExbB
MIGFVFLSIFSAAAVSWAQPKADSIKTISDTVQKGREGMSLWELIVSGGSIMYVLGILSVGAVALIVYDFKNLKASILAPAKFAEEVIQNLEKKEEKVVKGMCQAQQNIIARIVMAGLEKKNRGIVFAREAMENCARKELGKLWQNISYLSDIATIAPLLGLLGTVIGMIQAFNVVAFQSGFVKPIMLAGGVSKAMVTTAAGLIVAIPVMLFYSYFRTKVEEVSDAVETYAADIIKIMEEA